MSTSTAETGSATITDQPAARQLTPVLKLARREWRPITMPGIIALALIAIVALTILSLTVHILFSPWLLVVIGILAWIKFRPRRSHP